VKKSKLDFELAKSGAPGDKQQERERSNRASAAASRAKLLFYASTLEERTDRLEQERNLARDKLVVKRVNMTRVRKERDELRAVLADVWSIGDKRTCDWLVEVNAFRHVEDSEGSGADECEVGQGVFGEDREANVGRGTRRAMDVSTLQNQGPERAGFLPPMQVVPHGAAAEMDPRNGIRIALRSVRRPSLPGPPFEPPV
jgi:hypothetical protein